MGELFDDNDFVGDPPFGDLVLVDGEEGGGVDGVAGLRGDDQEGAFVPFGVAGGDDGGFGDVGVADSDVLELDGADPLAAGFDDVLGAVGDLHRAAGVDGGDVAGGEPAVRVAVVGVCAHVAAGDPGAADGEVAEGGAVPGEFVALVVGDAHVDAGDGPALLVGEAGAFGLGHGVVGGLGGVDGAEGAGFGHAPGVVDRDAVGVAEGVDDDGRAGGAAADEALQRVKAAAGGAEVLEEAHPDGGDAGGEGDALLVHEALDGGAVEVAAGHDEAGADHGGGIGQAPGVDVEHGDDGHDAVRRAEAEDVGEVDGVGVEEGATVAVEHAFGPAGGAAGVAEGAGEVLVEDGPGEVFGAGGEQGFVVVEGLVGWGEGGRGYGAAHENDGADGGGSGEDCFEQGGEAGVGADDHAAGVVEDVDDVVGGEAGVHGVDDGAHAGDGVVELEMALAVPGEGGDTVALGDAEGLESAGEATAATLDVAVGCAGGGAVFLAGDDLGLTMVAGGVGEDGGDQQRLALHEAEHDISLCAPGAWGGVVEAEPRLE